MAIKLIRQLTFDKNKIIFICIRCGKQLLVDRMFGDSNNVTKIISSCSNCSSIGDIEIHLDKYEYVVLRRVRTNRENQENIRSNTESNDLYKDRIYINWDEVFKSIKIYDSYTSTITSTFNPWEY